MPVSATIEKMLVFTAYFQLVDTPPNDSSCHLPTPFVTLGGDNLKKKSVYYFGHLMSNLVTRRFSSTLWLWKIAAL